MKYTKTLLLAFTLSIVMTACESNEIPEAQVSEEQEVSADAMAGVTYDIVADKSRIRWEGHKAFVEGWKHNGYISIKDGNLTVAGDQLKGGEVVINMQSIALTEEDAAAWNNAKWGSYEQGNLLNHLKDSSFFDVGKYPASQFVITSVEPMDSAGYNARISGNMTIKEATKNLTFPAKVNVKDDRLVADAKVVIDRSDFQVRYGSADVYADLAQDQIIAEDILLDLHLEAVPANAVVTQE